MTAALARSLRHRLIIGSAVGLLVAMLLAGLIIALMYRQHATASFIEELDHHLEELLAATVPAAGGGMRVRHNLSDPQFQAAGSGLYWQVERGGHPILRSGSLDGRTLAATPPAEGWMAQLFEGEKLIQRSVERRLTDGQPVTATMASARFLLDREIADFHRDLALSMGMIGLLLLAGAVLLVRYGLMPVERLARAMERLRNGETSRLDLDYPMEFAPIVARLNAVLDDQARMIARARTNAGNLAHNLRTPLALIADEAEQLRHAGEAAAGDFLLARCHDMRRQIDWHMARAAAAGQRGGGTLVEAEPLTQKVAAAMRRQHAGRGVTIEVEMQPDLRLAMEEGDLAEILLNLVDNGCKWARTRVVITGHGNGFDVSDDGPGIPPAQREAVLSIGTRLDNAASGAGLGLAAVADLLTLYCGHLRLDAAPLGGLRARVSLPVLVGDGANPA